MSKYDAAERDAVATLEAAGIGRTQRCVHAVAKLYARLAQNEANQTDDGTPYVYPSPGYVAGKVGYSERHVKRANATLKGIGFIKTIGRMTGKLARHAIRAVSVVVGKGDTAAQVKVTPEHGCTPAAPIYPFNGKKQHAAKTPTPPPYVPDPPKPVADPALRARLCSGWRDLAKA